MHKKCFPERQNKTPEAEAKYPNPQRIFKDKPMPEA